MGLEWHYFLCIGSVFPFLCGTFSVILVILKYTGTGLLSPTVSLCPNGITRYSVFLTLLFLYIKLHANFNKVNCHEHSSLRLSAVKLTRAGLCERLLLCNSQDCLVLWWRRAFPPPSLPYTYMFPFTDSSVYVMGA